jgi:catechol 2,3-dioxygenase-like lactoylglutathione lyase family enzyme
VFDYKQKVKNMTDQTKGIPQWQGFHHLALVTPNLDATITFYRDTIGMQLAATGEANPIHGRTAVFIPGEGKANIHFFELATAQIFTPSPDVQGIPWIPGALHHIAFELSDEAAAIALRERLQARGVPMLTEIMDQGDCYNMIFADNNGMMLEANWAKG